MIIALLLNFITGFSAYLLTGRLLKPRSLVDASAAFFILFLSLVVIIELALGIICLLWLKHIVLLFLAIFFVLFLTLYGKRNADYSFNIRNSLSFILGDKIILFAICVLLVFGVVKGMINLINPPFGWDCLNYHFTFPVEWMKNGNLINPITVFDDPSPTYYPINGSLWFFWLMLPLKNVFLADIGQIPFFILAGISLYGICRKLRLGRENSICACVLFALIPNFFKQLQVAYVDVMVAALFLACVNFLLALDEEFRVSYAAIFGLSAGLLIGIKTVALPYAALLAIPFLYLIGKDIKRRIPSLVLALFFIVLLGGFSYLRNFFETGNALYPFDFKFGGLVVFKGVMDSFTYRAHFVPSDYRITKLLFHEGLGLQTLLFVMPSVFLSLPFLLIRKVKKLSFVDGYVLSLPLWLFLVWRFLIPLANSRYLYPCLGLGIACGFFVFSRIKTPRVILRFVFLLCVVSAMFELAKRVELVVSLILTWFIFLALAFYGRRILKMRFRNGKIITAAAVLSVLLFFAGLEKIYAISEFPGYSRMVKYSGFWPDAAAAWQWLNKNTEGNNIAYAGRPVPCPLYGSNFKNNVYYVSVNKTDPAKLHYFTQGKYRWGYDFAELHRNLEADGNYRSGSDYQIWLYNLLKRGTDYLFIYSLHQTKQVEFPREDYWAKEHPQRFIPEFKNETIRIYRLIK